MCQISLCLGVLSLCRSNGRGQLLGHLVESRCSIAELLPGRGESGLQLLRQIRRFGCCDVSLATLSLGLTLGLLGTTGPGRGGSDLLGSLGCDRLDLSLGSIRVGHRT